MLAFIIGLLGGIAEFFLLRCFVANMLTANTSKAMLIIPLKLAVIALSLGIVAWQTPQLLWLAGIAMVIPLLIGGVASFLIGFSSKKNANKSQK